MFVKSVAGAEGEVAIPDCWNLCTALFQYEHIYILEMFKTFYFV